MERIVLVDAYSQIFRCYYAIRAAMTNKAGEPVNALYGIARLLLQLEKTQPSGYGAICFDKGGSKRRKEILPEYKAQRAPMPDELRVQIPYIQEWMSAFGWNLVVEEGVEADDLIAGITVTFPWDCVRILTHDKDIAQLVAHPGDVKIISPGKNGTWEESGREQVLEKFGVPPELLGDYLALVGDAVDNIRGVDGVGPKTASKLLMEAGSLQGLCEKAAAMKPGKVRDALMSGGDLLERNRSLVALDTELPDAWRNRDSLKRHAPDWKRLKAMAEEQSFVSLLPVIEANIKDSVQLSLF